MDADETAARRTLSTLARLFGDSYLHGFAVELWDGTHLPALGIERFALRITAPQALRVAFAPPIDVSPGVAFADGLIDVTGDLEAAVAALGRAFAALGPAAAAALFASVRHLPKPDRRAGGGIRLQGLRHSRERDAAAIGFHYDLPLAFYASFLDPELVYSCAYFDDGVASLAQAQLSKLDHILRKLRLQPGERLLDIGCGWGALVARAAERFGAHAEGITLSRAQFDEARRRLAARNLGKRASIELRDYRDIRGGPYDKIASIGMIEHVGREHLDEYFAAVFAALRPGGLFLNHGITDQGPSRRGWRSSGFMGRYVFPDGDLLPLWMIVRSAERAGFEVRDVENLREHYARTLRAWLENLRHNESAAIAASDERTVRIWRLYMAGSAEGFHTGRMGLVQAVLEKPLGSAPSTLPPTRRDLYASPAAREG